MIQKYCWLIVGVTLMPAASPAQSSSELPRLLTIQDAERLALLNNPRIHVTQLLAKVQGQIVRETRAAELPALTANITAVNANQASRVSSGVLTASQLLTHAGAGVQLSQLITDFGRTRNLVAAEKLREKARQSDVEASREDIVLATDELFFQAVGAQATLQIADQTITTRQTLVDQVSALTNAKLKSSLDLSFAEVNLARSKLLQLDSQNNLAALKAALTTVMGFDSAAEYSLADDTGELPPLLHDPTALVGEALRNRPDLQSLQFSKLAAQKFALAERAQLLPTIGALGVVGSTPAGASQYFTPNWYGAIGINIGIPLFDGFRFRSQIAEATLQAQVVSEHSRDLRDQVVRDVRKAWLNANTALQRVVVTAELLKQASLSADLAQTRYGLGLSSIVELSEAQLQQTEAAIGEANARSQYRAAMAALRFQTGGPV